MDNQYGVQVTNKFALFSNEEDPFDILREQEELKSKKDVKSVKEPPKALKETKNIKNKKPITSTTDSRSKLKENISNDEKYKTKHRQVELEKNNKNTSDSSVPKRDTRRFDDINKNEQYEKTSNRANVDRQPFNDFSRSERQDFPRGRGGRGMRGGGRGTRGSFDSRFGKREYERHSGSEKTGIKPVDKRDGGGAHNWGNVRDDLQEPLNDSNISEETPEFNQESEENESKDNIETADVSDEKIEETVSEMTLDEYRASLKQEESKAEFNIRKPNEGADTKQWKKTYVLKKKEVDEDEEEEEEEDDDENSGPRQKNFVDIQITFNDSRRGGGGGGPGSAGGRGMRGRGRGGESRGYRGGGGRGGGFGGNNDFNRSPSYNNDGNETGFFGGSVPSGGRGGGQRGSANTYGGRGGDRRGGRGGFRGGRGGGGGGSGYAGRKDMAPLISDENDFPSLVKAS